MGVTFVVGRAGTGKTHLCLSALQAELARPGESRRLLLLVPEQSSFQMERALAVGTRARGFWRAEVLSFSRLSLRLFAESGSMPTVLRPAARMMALRLIVQKDEFAGAVFGRAARTEGFFVQLDRLIAELIGENVTPAALAEAMGRLAAGAGRDKVDAIARVYGRYLDWVGEERLDFSMHLALLRERIVTLPWLAEASIWVDGFAGFSGQELATLVALGRTTREVTITLLMDPRSPVLKSPAAVIDDLGLFARTERTYRDLCKHFGDAEIEVGEIARIDPAVPPRFLEAPQLAELEAGIAADGKDCVGALSEGGQEPGMAQVTLMACATHREELEQAARSIRRMILDSGGQLRYRDFAVIARDLEPFAELVAEVFEEYELPHFLDRRRTMRSHALCRLIQALLECVRGGFPCAAASRLIRTGLLPLAQHAAEELETFVTRFAIRGARRWAQASPWQFADQPWRRGEKSGYVCALSQEAEAGRLEVFAAIEPLMKLAESQRGAGPRSVTGDTWARQLHQTLERLGVRSRLERWIGEAEDGNEWETGALHRTAWEAVCDLLDDLSRCLGSAALTIDELDRILESSLADMTLALAPPTLDQVLISSIDRSRHPDVRHAWLFGFNDGIFPAQPPQDAFLTGAERQALTAAGLPAPAAARDEAFGERLLAYVACTRPSRSLTLSYAAVDEVGRPLTPSSLLEELRAVLPVLRTMKPDAGESPVNLNECARGYFDSVDSRAAGDSAGAGNAASSGALRAARYRRLRQELGGVVDRPAGLEWLLRGSDYANRVSVLRGAAVAGGVAAPGGGMPSRSGEPAWSGTPSELRSYIQCPFQHFLRYRLRLESQDGPSALSAGLGSVAHEILAECLSGAESQPDSGRSFTDEQWQELLARSISDFEQTRLADLAEMLPQHAYVFALLKPFLGEVVAAHAARFRRGRFEPFKAEWAFETPRRAGGLPALELRTAAGDLVRIRGKIDRVDRCRTERGDALIVYDYKSNAGSLRTEYLTEDRLQVFVYMLAVREALAREPGIEGLGRESVVAGVLIAPLRPNVGMLGNKYFQNAAEDEQRMFVYRPRGKIAQSVADALDERLGSQPSPVAAIQKKKDGGFYQNCDACPDGEIESVADLARRTLLYAAEGVIEGAVQIAPLSENKCLACNYCEFKPVCRYEHAYNDVRNAGIALPQLRAGHRP